MIRPSPRDVLYALDELKPGYARAVLGRAKFASHASVRRTAMAVARSYGHSFPMIGKSFDRDHSTVVYAVQRYCEMQAKKHRIAYDEAQLFRRLVVASVEFAQRRAA